MSSTRELYWLLMLQTLNVPAMSESEVIQLTQDPIIDPENHKIARIQ